MYIKYILYLVLFFFSINSIFSVTYYVDNTNGNDSNSGLKEIEAFKTISKINSMTFQPGDYILFKRDDTWVGQTLLINGNGTFSNPITYSSYGTGNKPIINGNYIIDYGIENLNNKHIIIQDFEVKNILLHGIRNKMNHYLDSSYNIINNVHIHDNGDGTIIKGIYGIVNHGSDLKITNCKINNIIGDGIYTRGSNVEIGHCNISNIDLGSYSGDNIHLNLDSKNFHIHHNYLDHRNSNKKGCAMSSDSSDNVNGIYEYNICLGSAGQVFGSSFKGGNVTVRYNKYVDEGSSKSAIGVVNKNSKYYYNVIEGWDNGFNAISNGSGIKIFNNVLINIDNRGLNSAIQETDNKNTEYEFKNNIIQINPGARVYQINTDYVTANLDYNILYPEGTSFIRYNTSFNTLLSHQSTNNQDLNSESIDPQLNNDLTLKSTSPAINTGTNLGNEYNMGLHPSSTWPNNVILVNQNDYGSWEKGAFVNVESNTYYVSYSLGNDSNNGLYSTNQGNGNGPFKTISKINSMTFQPGDNILFKRGETWREQLIIPSSGDLNNPITFGAYASGEKPIINPSKIISNWGQYNGNIYVGNISTNVKTVIVDNKFYDIAHHPNNDYIKIAEDSLNLNSFKTIDTGLTFNQINGSKIRLRITHWRIDEFDIINYDTISKTLTLDKDGKYDIKKDYGYFFIDKFWMLDQEKEWYYNSTSNKLYIWFENSDIPQNHIIEVPFSESGIEINRKENIVIKDLEIKNTQNHGIYFIKGVNYKVDNVDVSNSGENGIFLRNWNTKTTHNEIINSSFKNNLKNGARLAYVNNVLIENNIFQQNGVLSIPIKSDGGLKFRGDNIIARNNIIEESGYNGLMYHGYNNLIENNFINNSCIVLDDCGGTYNGGNTSSNNTLKNNIILNSIGNNKGVPGYSGSNGIYLDNGVSNTILNNNIISNVRSAGIFLHYTTNTSLNNNLVYNAKSKQLLIVEGHHTHPEIGPGHIQNIDIFNNTFCAINDSQLAIRKTSLFHTIDFATFKNNSYCYTKNFIKINYKPDYPILGESAFTVSNFYNFNEWQNLFNKDNDSSNLRNTFNIIDYTILNSSNNLLLNGDFNTSKEYWGSGWSSEPGHVFTSWKDNCELGFGGCLETYTDRDSFGDILTSSSKFPIEKDFYYNFEFSWLGNSSDKARVIIRLAGNPNYDPVGFNKEIFYNQSRKNFKEVFKSTSSNSEVRIDFQSDFANSKIQIDNVSLRKVNISLNNPQDDILFLLNNDFTSKKIFNLNQRFCDLNNNIIEKSVEIEPFSAKVLFSCFCNNDYVCNNYENHTTCPTDCNFGEGYVFNNTIHTNQSNNTNFCGDFIINNSEVCDKTNLNGETCQTQSFDKGTLACSNDCLSFDTSSCSYDDNSGSGGGGGSFCVSCIQDINITNSCLPNYYYHNWSECIKGEQYQFIEDLNLCSGDILDTRKCEIGLNNEENMLFNAQELVLNKYDYKKYESNLHSDYNGIFYINYKLEDSIFLLKDNESQQEYFGQYYDTIDDKYYYTLKRVDEGIITIMQEEGILDLPLEEETNSNLQWYLGIIILIIGIIFGFYYFRNKKVEKY